MGSLHASAHPIIDSLLPFAAILVLLGTVACAVALVLGRALHSRLRSQSRFLLLAMALLLPFAAVLMLALPADLGALAGSAVDTSEIVIPDAPPGLTVDASGGSSELRCLAASVWMAGILFFLAIEVVRLRRSRLAVQPAKDHDRAHEVRAVTGHLRHPILVASGCTDPMVEGFLRPRIVIPEDFASRLTTDELHAVLAHEVRHIERRDNIVALVLRMASIVAWFDPLRWLALRAAMDERERACDEHVVESGHVPETYINAVLKSCGGIDTGVAACITSSRIGERIDSIMSFAESHHLSHRLVRNIAFAVVLGTAMGFAFVVPRPVLAAMSDSGTGQPFARAESIVLHDGTIEVRAQMYDAEGKLVSAPRLIVPAGDEASMTSQYQNGDQLAYRLTVRPDAQGNGTAVFEVSSNGAIVHTSTAPLTKTEARPRSSDAQPIDLVLKEADLRDVLRTFSQLTGKTIDYDESVQGSVTIDVDDAPWDQVLGLVLGMNGYSYEWEGADRIVVRERRSGDGAVRVDARSVGIPAERQSEPLPGEEAYLSLADDIRKPVLMTSTAVEYTPEAKAQRVQGVVIVRALIDENGTVQGVRVVKGLPFGLNDEAIEAVRDWRFEPATRGGVPVKVAMNITINFRLDSGS